MPTIVSHAAVPLAIGLGLGRRAVSGRLLAAGVVAAMLPDLDVLAFRAGIAYADQFGHRGFSHSLLLAFLLAVVAALFAERLRAARLTAFLFVLAAMASHGLLDMLTNGGLGVAWLWPFSDRRFFFPVQPIQVAPLGLHRLLGPAGTRVLTSELLWIWLPAALVSVLMAFGRSVLHRRI